MNTYHTVWGDSRIEMKPKPYIYIEYTEDKDKKFNPKSIKLNGTEMLIDDITITNDYDVIDVEMKLSAGGVLTIRDVYLEIKKLNVRPDWDEYFLGIAKAVAVRADCRRAQHGAVIVSGRRIVSTGYNGSPAGGLSCLAGECPRGLQDYSDVPSLTGGYDGCVAQHAEGNAIAYASHHDTMGATIYVTGEPCIGCWKNIQAAGIVRVVWPDGDNDVRTMRWPYRSDGGKS
jgi:dCMP deaminase